MKFFTLIACLVSSAALGQTVEIENGGQEAMGFITIHGLFTSDPVSYTHLTLPTTPYV